MFDLEPKHLQEKWWIDWFSEASFFSECLECSIRALSCTSSMFMSIYLGFSNWSGSISLMCILLNSVCTSQDFAAITLNGLYIWASCLTLHSHKPLLFSHAWSSALHLHPLTLWGWIFWDSSSFLKSLAWKNLLLYMHGFPPDLNCIHSVHFCLWVLTLGFWAAISSVSELYYISFSSTCRCQHRSSRLRFHIR